MDEYQSLSLSLFSWLTLEFKVNEKDAITQSDVNSQCGKYKDGERSSVHGTRFLTWASGYTVKLYLNKQDFKNLLWQDTLQKKNLSRAKPHWIYVTEFSQKLYMQKIINLSC